MRYTQIYEEDLDNDVIVLLRSPSLLQTGKKATRAVPYGIVATGDPSLLKVQALPH
jgi:hypothetical protein